MEEIVAPFTFEVKLSSPLSPALTDGAALKNIL
jgi:hypothetical protein